MKTPSIKNNGASVIIAGISGYIGQFLYEGLSPKFKVHGTYCNSPVAGGIHYDLTSSDPETLSLAKIKYAILLAAKTKIDYCKLNPEQSRKVNVDGLIRLLTSLRKHHVFPIFLSSDAVYPGITGNYDESCPGPAVNDYGVQKRLVEDHIREHFDKYCILRIPKTVGYLAGKPDLLETLYQGLAKGEELHLLEDQRFQLLSLDDLQATIEFVMNHETTGIFNTAAPEATNRIEIAHHLASLMKVSTHNIKKVRMRDFRFADKRAENSAMRIDKFLRLTDFKFQGPREITRIFLLKHGICPP